MVQIAFDGPGSMGSSEDVTMLSETLLRPDQAADYLNLSKATLAKWRVHGDGPAHLKIGSRIAYSMGDIEEWLSARRYQNTARPSRSGPSR